MSVATELGVYKANARWKQLSDKKREGLLIAGLFIVAAFLRFWMISSRPGIVWDETTFNSIAQNIWHGHLSDHPAYGESYADFLFQPPFYVGLLALWQKIVGPGILAGRLLGASGSLVGLSILYGFMRQEIGRTAAFIATGLLAVDSWMVYANRIGWMENIAIILAIGSMWLYWRAMDKPTERNFLIAGVALGAAVVFKHTDLYLILGVLFSWGISRSLKREHLILLGVVAGIVALYVMIMTLVYGLPFWSDIGEQVSRSFGSSSHRQGTISAVSQLINPLVHQYKVFVGTLMTAAVAVVLMVVRLVQCLRAHTFELVRPHQVIFSWALAGIIGFGVVQLRFPSYFELLYIPMVVYLVVEGIQWVEIGSFEHRKAVAIALAVIAVVLGLFGFWWRILDHTDNAIGQTAQWVRTHIPQSNVILTEVTIGDETKQPWCNIEWDSAEWKLRNCAVEKWAITYTSADNQLSDLPQISRKVLAHSTPVKRFVGFEEVITVWRIKR